MTSLPTARRALATFLFVVEVAFWEIATYRRMDTLYGFILAIIVLPLTGKIGIPLIYPIIGGQLASFFWRPRRRLMRVRDRRFEAWKRTAENIGREELLDRR